jgi:hypothetical protein
MIKWFAFYSSRLSFLSLFFFRYRRNIVLVRFLKVVFLLSEPVAREMGRVLYMLFSSNAVNDCDKNKSPKAFSTSFLNST